MAFPDDPDVSPKYPVTSPARMRTRSSVFAQGNLTRNRPAVSLRQTVVSWYEPSRVAVYRAAVVTPSGAELDLERARHVQPRKPRTFLVEVQPPSNDLRAAFFDGRHSEAHLISATAFAGALGLDVEEGVLQSRVHPLLRSLQRDGCAGRSQGRGGPGRRPSGESLRR